MKKNRFDLQQMKTNGEKAVWMTAYDYVTAQLAEKAGMEKTELNDFIKGRKNFSESRMALLATTLDEDFFDILDLGRGLTNRKALSEMADVEDRLKQSEIHIKELTQIILNLSQAQGLQVPPFQIGTSQGKIKK